MKRRGSRLAMLFAVALLTPTLAWGRLAVVPGPSALPTTNWLDYTIIGEDFVDIGPNLNLAGNFACWASGCSVEVALNSFQLDDTPPPFMAADTLNLGNNASVANAYTNSITGSASGEVRGVVESQSFPLPLSLPTFPTTNVCDTCTVSAGDVVVDPDDTITLVPGCYGELFARARSAVFLQPGTYHFKEWDIQKFASVTANGPVIIYIREQIATEESNFLGAASAQVSDFQVWIGARKSCQPSSSAINSVIGKFSVVIGTFVAPADDDFNYNKSAVMIGTTVAKGVCIRGTHDARPPTPTPTSQPTPTPNNPTPTPTSQPTPTPNGPTPTPSVTPTPNGPTPTPSVTPTPNGPTPTPSVTPTPNFPTPTPTQPFTPPTPTPTSTPHIDNTPTPVPTTTPRATNTPRKLPTPTPTQPFTPPTPTPLPTINPPPPTEAPPRKHPWGKKSGLIESLFPSRTGDRIAPSMKRPLGVRR